MRLTSKRISGPGIICVLSLMVLMSPAVFSRDIPVKDHLEILKAEDELRFDQTLIRFMKSADPELRSRAALAAGRIGDEDAIPVLEQLLFESDPGVRQIAAFALGEIESVKASESIIRVLDKLQADESVRARAVEAAGKIAAANPKSDAAKKLGDEILANLAYEAGRRSAPSDAVILMGVTAVLRAKPENADRAVAKFLGYSEWRIRADALNTLARLNSKIAFDEARKLLRDDPDPVVRANAARLLGGEESKTSTGLLLDALLKDEDLRVRINAIRTLGSLSDKAAVPVLVEKARKLFDELKSAANDNPAVKNEILTIISSLGNLLKGTEDSAAVSFFKEFRVADHFSSSETEVAFARVAPEAYLMNSPFSAAIQDSVNMKEEILWKITANIWQGLAEISKLPDEKMALRNLALKFAHESAIGTASSQKVFTLSFPNYLAAIGDFKPCGNNECLSPDVESIGRYLVAIEDDNPLSDPFVKAAAASVLGELNVAKETLVSLKRAFSRALKYDTRYDDAQLAILSALVKLDKDGAKESLNLALDHYAFLIRRQAAKLIKDNGMERDFPNLKARVGTVRPYDPKTGSKLGQITNTDADYRRALSRKNGNVKAVLTTAKGKFTIEFYPEEAPLTVDNYIKLAKSGYFNGLEIHRVVPNFVMQDGDPRGDGNGGPGWQIRCEINQIPYERGTVGMALSGKDTGGSQWFVAHSPQPHLDGGYTVFGKVNEEGMKVVDKLVRGDKILKVSVSEQ